MQKKVSTIKELKNSGLSASLRMGLLIVSQRVPLKYKAPKVIVSNTPQQLALEEIKNRWAKVRQDLKNILKSIEEADQKKLIFKHPLAGKFNAKQAIVFLKEHIHHHLPQINRLIRK
jgi:cysteinyl-tRNA synthetase